MDSESKIILVDAFSQIYRGFFAVRNLSNSKGMPTNAVFSIGKFLTGLEKEFAVKLGAFVFDLGKPRFRLEISPEYKANRAPMPDDMKIQMPYIKKIIKAFGWPSFDFEGYEADDIIAGICKEFPDHELGIVSSDKDLAQLVNPKVHMLIPKRKSKGFNDTGPEEVFAKFAVTPEQMVLYLSLIGDSSDNIPGVPGVGPKTAAKLLTEFPSSEIFFKNYKKIENKRINEKISENIDVLKKNIELIKLKAVIPEEVKSPESMTKKEPDFDIIKEICNELEMKSILKELEKTLENKENEYCKSKMQDLDKNRKNLFNPDLFD